MDASIGIIFGIIAMLGYGLSNAISQIPSKQLGSRKTIFYRNIFISIFLFIILIAFLKDATFSIKYIFITFVISLISYIPLLTFYKALKFGKVGIIVPIASSSVIFTVLFSIIFLVKFCHLSR